MSLPEADYNAVLEVITRLLSHKTMSSLTRLFQSHLLPLLGASTCFYASADSEFLRPRIIDAVGIPKSEFETIQAYFPCCPLAQQIVNRSSPVGTYEVDIPRSKLQDSVAKFFQARPAPQLRGSSYLDEIRTTLLAIDPSEPAVVLGFHRLNSCRESFTGREKRILELLRPHLCQAIKNLILNEGLNNRGPAMGEDPWDSQSPMAQVTRDSKIVEQNPRFRKMFKSRPGDKLGSTLARFLGSGIRDHEKAAGARIPETEAFWYCLCPSVFKVDICRHNDDLWLLELHPVSDACPAFNPILRQFGLTPKEKEICCRVRQGFGNREIASQLCISFHTAKTHLKNIYRKLDIPNRPRLVSFLNNNQSLLAENGATRRSGDNEKR